MQGTCADCKTFRKWLHKHNLKLQTTGGTDADGRLAHSPEAQKKRGETMKRLWADPEYRKRQIEKRLATWHTRDREKQAKVMRKIWTPEKREKHSALLKKLQTGRKGDIRLPQNKEKLSEDLKLLWSEVQ